MEENNTNQAAPSTGKGLGIAGMILGIVAIVVSFIPCFGMAGIVMAVVGLVLSVISLNQAKKANAPKGMAMAGLICSIVAIIIASIWIFVVAKVATHAVDAAKMLEESGAMDSLNKAMEQLKNITDTMQNH